MRHTDRLRSRGDAATLAALLVAWLRRGVRVAVCTAGVVCAGCAERVPDAAHTLPFGFLDTPAPGASVARVTRVAGWALDDG
jgi:hypothetical protein